MSLVLLDTHVLVWLLNTDPKLTPKAVKAINQSLAEEELMKLIFTVLLTI